MAKREKYLNTSGVSVKDIDYGNNSLFPRVENNQLHNINTQKESYVNDYIKRYNDRLGSDSGKQATSPSDDYYKLARDQEYGLLFDKEVALENAKANALKYTRNQINAQGFGGTGYGSSIQSGLYNTYLSKANEARNDYAENIRNINLQEQQAKQESDNDRFQSVTTMLQGADTKENMNKLLVDYGYGTLDKDNNFVWNKEKPEGMSDDDWYQMQYYYRMKANDLDQVADETSFKLNSFDNLFNYMATQSGKINENGDAVQQFSAETKALWTYATANQVDNNGVVKVTNGEGKTTYLKWVGNGYVPSNATEYEGAKSKYTCKWNGSAIDWKKE